MRSIALFKCCMVVQGKHAVKARQTRGGRARLARHAIISMHPATPHNTSSQALTKHSQAFSSTLKHYPCITQAFQKAVSGATAGPS